MGKGETLHRGMLRGGMNRGCIGHAERVHGRIAHGAVGGGETDPEEGLHRADPMYRGKGRKEQADDGESIIQNLCSTVKERGCPWLYALVLGSQCFAKSNPNAGL